MCGHKKRKKIEKKNQMSLELDLDSIWNLDR